GPARAATQAAQRSVCCQQQEDGGEHRAEAMREMDGHARRVIQYSAGVVDAQPAPQDEGVLVVRIRQPLRLALREIRAGHRRVVAAGPAAEEYLQSER